MEWVLRTIWTNFIQKLTPKLWNQVEFMKHTTQPCLVWLAMVWTSSQRISTLLLKWRLEIGCAFQVWEPILMDPRATSTEWKAHRRSSDGMPNFMRIQLRYSNLQEFNSFDYYWFFSFNTLLLLIYLHFYNKLKL